MVYKKKYNLAVSIFTLFAWFNLSSANIRFKNIPSLNLLPKQTIWSINQDLEGFLWIGSKSNLLKYNGYEVTSIHDIFPSKNISDIIDVTTDDFGNLWIGTKNNGLFQVIGNKIKNFNFTNINVILASENGTWIGTKSGLIFINQNNQSSSYRFSNTVGKNTKITGMVDVSEDKLLITMQYAIFVFDKNTHTFSKQEIKGLDNTYINTAYKDYEGSIWIATDLGVYFKAKNDSEFQAYRREKIDFRINTISVDDKNIWLGSGLEGLFKISKLNSTITNYKNDVKDSSSISGNSIMSMYLNNSGMMFISSFHGGLSYFDTNTLNFGLENNSINSIYCADSPVFYGVDIDNEDNIWISAQSGLIEYNPANKKCINHNLDTNNSNAFIQNYPLFSFKSSSNERWMATSKGLNKIDSVTGLIDKSYQQYVDKSIYFMLEIDPGIFLLGTVGGLYSYSSHSNTIKKIESVNQNLSNTYIRGYTKDSNGDLYLATYLGLAVLDDKNIFNLYNKIQKQLPTNEVWSVFSNNQELWVGTGQYGVFKFNKSGELITRYDDRHGIPKNLSIFSMLSDGVNLWMGTDNGLVRLNTETDLAYIYHKSAGLQSDFFIAGSAYKSPSGKLFFGGRGGLNAFYPKDIKINTTPPNIVLTQFTRFGKVVQPSIKNDDFTLEKPINDLDELTLTHKDYVVGFEFSALDFADPSRNKYAYKMQGLDPDWNYVNADDRKTSYTNLKPGDYTFKVKGANKDGVWNETGKSLKIKVLPAPWLTWWAYTCYLLALFGIFFWYLHRKNKANAQITQMLRTEVKKQTKELHKQKQTVESLLARKNELFANVSHEFRTPLTLILGPVNNLLKSPLRSDDIKSLQMVNRNANRLLTMIEQLLQLAKINDHENITFIPQQVHPNVETIVASFQGLADVKNITLKLDRNDEAAINATQDVLDIVMGNLISNAIKYTQVGGTVTVNSYKLDKHLTIEVTDTGCGLDKQQQVEIFSRFKPT